MQDHQLIRNKFTLNYISTYIKLIMSSGGGGGGHIVLICVLVMRDAWRVRRRQLTLSDNLRKSYVYNITKFVVYV